MNENIVIEGVGNDIYELEAENFSVWSSIIGPKTYEEDFLKRKLKYFFYNPYEKCLAKKKFPWKLFIQFIKIFFVTWQLIDFGTTRSLHIEFMDKTNLAFKHLFLKDWSLSYETMPYPPSSGKMAVYTLQEFYDTVDYVLTRYNSTEDIAIGNFNFASSNHTVPPVKFCITSYLVGSISAFNESFIFDPRSKTECLPVVPILINKLPSWNIEVFLSTQNKTIIFDGLIDVKLLFSLRTVHLKSLIDSNEPDCYQFDVEVNFDNSGHNGQMAFVLTSKSLILNCAGHVIYGEKNFALMREWILNVLVMVICFISISLCIRSIIRAFKLLQETEALFAKYYPGRVLFFSERLEFVDFWYMLIICNDLLTLIGSIFKILIEYKVNMNYEMCGILLGTGSLFVWFGILRYLALFKSFNVLIVTLKKAAPNVCKFLVCAFFIFIGFSICGWIVLGPYHIKFRELATSLECLYSLINGDDLYTTFATMNQVSLGVWLFSRLYLYVFISLFIYVILSMFICIISDTYESVKHPESADNMKSRLRCYANEYALCPSNLFPDHLFPKKSHHCDSPSRKKSTPNKKLVINVEDDDSTPLLSSSNSGNYTTPITT